MARRNIPDLDLLTEQWEPKVRQAFLESIEGLTDRVKITELARLIERGDIEGVLDYLRINRLSYQRLEIAIRDAYEAGGFRFAGSLPGFANIIFDVRNPQAEQWLREYSSSRVTELVDDQRQAIRAHLTEGLQQGNNPRSSALDLVGRISRATGRREGGVVGLTEIQRQWQRNYAEELRDAHLFRGDIENHPALQRASRNKVFDRTVAKAVRERKPIPADMRRKMVLSYRNGLLKYRGEVIARHETLQSLRNVEYEAYRQAVERGELRPDQIEVFWDSVPDERRRFSHAVLHGKSVPFGGIFISPLGSQMRFPGDTSLNARKEDIILCRCKPRFRVRFE